MRLLFSPEPTEVKWYRFISATFFTVPLLLASTQSNCQTMSGLAFIAVRSDTLPSDTLPSRQDIFYAVRGDSMAKANRPGKNPWVAVGLSAALPGAGQIYTRSYWKPPIIWGFGGYWIYEWTQMNSLYHDYRDQFSKSITPSTPSGNPYAKTLEESYRDERDKFAWYLGALYFLNLVDAYVTASLFDFDVGSDLGMNGKAEPRLVATVRLRF